MNFASKKLIHFVVAEDFVDTTTGSGIVHLSPANGEQDFDIALKRNLPIFVPIDDRVSSLLNKQVNLVIYLLEMPMRLLSMKCTIQMR